MPLRAVPRAPGVARLCDQVGEPVSDGDVPRLADIAAAEGR